ncbi:MAG: GNAT family N-acetyltransferase [Saprospiraceae bacterium]|nr:GNAT family N-acetyltransferase [Saprospiraceae bacterium]
MITYRPARAEEWPAIIELCVQTIRHVNNRDYRPDQINAWVSRIANPGRMQKRIREQTVWVACDELTMVGLITWMTTGYIDLLYVGKDHQGRGIGSHLLRLAEVSNLREGVHQLESDVSLTAKPLFDRRGFETVQQQQVVLGSVTLTNFKMTKRINHSFD